MQDSLKQLRYFIVIAECGKISEAAKHLYISRPALSAALAQLERLGIMMGIMTPINSNSN